MTGLTKKLEKMGNNIIKVRSSPYRKLNPQQPPTPPPSFASKFGMTLILGSMDTSFGMLYLCQTLDTLGNFSMPVVTMSFFKKKCKTRPRHENKKNWIPFYIIKKNKKWKREHSCSKYQECIWKLINIFILGLYSNF